MSSRSRQQKQLLFWWIKLLSMSKCYREGLYSTFSITFSRAYDCLWRAMYPPPHWTSWKWLTIVIWLSWTIIDYHRLSWTVMDCHGLSHTILDYNFTYWSLTNRLILKPLSIQPDCLFYLTVNLSIWLYCLLDLIVYLIWLLGWPDC